MFRLLLFILFIPIYVSAEDKPVEAELISTKINNELYLGALFKIKPDWHIYWKYPGDFGLATKVNFESEGVEFGALEWPEAQIFQYSGDILSYGYEREVLLFRKVLNTDRDNLLIDAKIKWLGCHKTLCLPGKLNLKKKINFNEDNQSIFKKYLDNLPKNIKDFDNVIYTKNINSSKYNLEFDFSKSEELCNDPDVLLALGKNYKLNDLKVNEENKKISIAFNLENFALNKENNFSGVLKCANSNSYNFNLD